MDQKTEFEKYKAQVVAVECDRIETCLKTAQVKTASPSRAGFRVQVRVSWKEPGGKPGLGYFALDTSNVGNVTATKYPLALRRDFVSALFRAEKWAAAAYAAAPSEIGGWSQFERAMLDALDSRGTLDDKAAVDKLLQQSLKAIQTVVNAGKDQKVRRIRNKKKAKDYLYQALIYALGSGLRDDEVRDLVKQALVEHTMKS